MIQKPSQQRSQRRLHQQMLRQQLQQELSRLCLSFVWSSMWVIQLDHLEDFHSCDGSPFLCNYVHHFQLCPAAGVCRECNTARGNASLSQHRGALAILYHDDHALIAQSKASRHVTLEWIADSGAGRDLASSRAFVEQGVSQSTIQRCTQSMSPIKFETGNGSYTADTCVALDGSTFGNANFSVMQDCPIVRSLGQIVAAGKPFVWLPGGLPFFCQDVDGLQLTVDSTKIHAASKVEDDVPIFQARSIQHWMCHIPKNPYCDICRWSRMYRRKVTRKRHDPLEARGELEEVTMFGQRLAADFTCKWQGSRVGYQGRVLGLSCSKSLCKTKRRCCGEVDVDVPWTVVSWTPHDYVQDRQCTRILVSMHYARFCSWTDVGTKVSAQ